MADQQESKSPFSKPGQHFAENQQKSEELQSLAESPYRLALS